MSGHQAFEAHEGLAAYSRAAREPPDLIITNIGLPGIDGIELIRRLKGTPHLQHIPIITITAGLKGQEALAAGCRVVLHKPFPVDQLLSAVESVV